MTAEEIIMKLQDSGYESYIAGGYVRDMILNVKATDKDIATSATPEELVKIFNNNKLKIYGKTFLVTVIDEIEVATFRTDIYQGFDDKEVKIESTKSVEKDAKRRDFTINSLYFDPFSKKIIDHVNGQKDLQDKIIRFNGIAAQRIWEDPNRMIRACRFLAKINGKFSKDTYSALCEFSSFIPKYVKPERIRKEILKAMEIKKASIFFNGLHETGALKYILPSLNDCFNHFGGPYHDEYVFEHCMMSGDHCSTNYPLIKLASYLHDVGKPIVSRINPITNAIWFEGHDEAGYEILQEELQKLRFSEDEINLISNLSRLHMRISNERLTPKSIRRTLKALNDCNVSYKNLLRVSISDKMGNLKSQKHYNIKNIYDLVKSFRQEIYRKNPVNKYSDLKVNGYDVMNITGLLPGREVGDILDAILDEVLDNPELNEKEKLLVLIKDKTNGKFKS